MCTFGVKECFEDEGDTEKGAEEGTGESVENSIEKDSIEENSIEEDSIRGGYTYREEGYRGWYCRRYSRWVH